MTSFVLHVFVNVATADEGFVAFLFIAENTDKIGGLDFLVEIADESASGDVATCDFVERMVHFCPGSFIRYRYDSVHSASCEYLLQGNRIKILPLRLLNMPIATPTIVRLKPAYSFEISEIIVKMS